MPSKTRKVLFIQKGFTLVELMVVLIILGVILGIGVPKYTKIQAQAEWDADKAMIESIAKAAEMYVIKKDIDLSENNKVFLSDLISVGVIDGDKILNRKNDSEKSVKNSNTSISAYGHEAFEFDPIIGNVTNLEGDTGIIVKLIGKSPYDET